MPRSKVCILIALHVLLVATVLVRLPRVGNPNELDCAWQGLLFHDWQHDVRAGVDSAFTYGPTGWLLAQSMFAPEGFVARFIAAWLIAAGTALALLAIVRHLPGARWRAAWFALLVVLAPCLQSSSLFQALVALGLATLLAVTAAAPAASAPAVAAAREGAAGSEPPRPALGARPIALLIATSLAFAVLGLAKFTYFVLGGTVVAATSLALIGTRRLRLAALPPALFAAAVAVVWLAAGQSLADLPSWLRTSSEIAAGYNEAMGIRGDFAETLWAIALFAAHALLACLLFWSARRAEPDRRLLAPANVRRAIALAIVLAGQFLTWKAGFVRQDIGHTTIYFGYATTTSFLLLAAAGVRRLSRPLAAAAAATLLAGAWSPLAALARDGAYLKADEVTARRVALLTPDIFVDYCRTQMAAMLGRPPLPRLRARVGDEPVDLLGYQQGLLLASGFRARHRPVFQSYSAYTAWLQQRNGEFFRGPDAPRFALANLQAIDDRLPTTEDSQAWLALLEDYHPTLIEQDIVLMERNADRAELAPPRLVADRPVVDHTVGWGEWVEVPQDGDWHELSLGIDFTLLGRAAAALYRIDRLHLEVRLADGAQRTFTIAPCLVRAPFLLDPLLRNNADLVRTWTGPPPSRVVAFRVFGDPARAYQFRQAGVAVRLLARPVPDHTLPASGPGSIERVADSAVYPGFSWLPYKVEPIVNFRTNGPGRGVLAHAPCTMFFRWPGGPHRLTAQFEIPPGAYTGSRRSDGATFRVEIADGGQEKPRRVAFERQLTPLEREADRGVQELELELDLPADTVVALVTHPGPAGRADSDWTTWIQLALSR